MFTRLLIGASVALLAACASAPQMSTAAHGASASATSTSGTAAANLPGTEACVFSFNIQSWEVLDNQTLLIQAPLKNDVYLVKLFAPANNLPFAMRVGFQDRDRDGQICRQDEIIVGGPVVDHWPITAVRKLTLAEANELRVQHGLRAVQQISKPEQKR
jgi:hypothetical protein